MHHINWMNPSRLIDRIQELMRGTDFASLRAVSVAAGLDPNFLRDIKSGRNLNPGSQKLAKVAGVLGTSSEDLLAAAGVETNVTVAAKRPEVVYCRVVGQVEAGAWREAIEWPEEKQFDIPILKDGRYPGVARYALELVGDSMNTLYPFPQTYVIFVRFLDIMRGPMPGETVIAHRQRHEMFEATCKTFTLNGAAGYLEPRSTNPAHRPLRLVSSSRELKEARSRKEQAAILRQEMGDEPGDTDVVDITGLVTGAYVQQ